MAKGDKVYKCLNPIGIQEPVDQVSSGAALEGPER